MVFWLAPPKIKFGVCESNSERHCLTSSSRLVSEFLALVCSSTDGTPDSTGCSSPGPSSDQITSELQAGNCAQPCHSGRGMSTNSLPRTSKLFAIEATFFRNLLLVQTLLSTCTRGHWETSRWSCLRILVIGRYSADITGTVNMTWVMSFVRTSITRSFFVNSL